MGDSTERSGVVTHDLRSYLERKIHRATAHLHGLGARDVAWIQEELRARLTTTPSLRALVAAATAPPRSAVR